MNGMQYLIALRGIKQLIGIKYLIGIKILIWYLLMRPRKSSTLIKKSQTLINSSHAQQLHNFTSNRSQVSQLILNSPFPSKGSLQFPVKGKFQVRGNLNKGSINPTSSFKRTFSRIKNDPTSIDHKRVDTPLIVNESIVVSQQIKQKDSIPKQSFYLQKSPQIKQSKINKTRVAFHKNTSKTNEKISKTSEKNYKGISETNPEQKKITKSRKMSASGIRQKMLNTRRSKLQSEVKKKQVIERENQKHKSLITPLKKSKNINIHTIKNPTNKITDTKQKVQAKDQEIQREQRPMKEEIECQQSTVERLEKSEQTIYKKELNHGVQIRKSKPNSIEENKKIELENQSLVENNIETRNHTPNQISQSTEQRQIQQRQNNPPRNLPQQNNHAFNLNQTQSSSSQFSQRQIEQYRRPQQQQNHSHIHQQEPNLPNNSNGRQIERGLNLTVLIANTQDIINFINRMNLRSRVQAFDLMVGQLTQLNMIAQQVQELGQIGNQLGYSLVNVFGTRIRQLQTTIINQVGQALIMSFEQRIDPQFQALVVRQPSLRQGFSKADIERTFDEKITFEEVQCSICLDSVKPGETIIELQCFHEYHPICIRTWLQNSRKCPMCRKEQALSL